MKTSQEKFVFSRNKYEEAVAQRYSVKRCFDKFGKIHSKTSVPESLFLIKLKENLENFNKIGFD